ncbi:MAG: SCO7613 C-terminal domain-containing membrane protein [Chloroflexaceae bacterium]
MAIWQRPLTIGPLVAGLGLSGLLLLWVVTTRELPALTFGLVNLALLLTTLAVRGRTIEYAYGACAALVGAGICQLYVWGFRDPQWYVVPAGIYLLALAEGLRHFQGQHQLSRMVETGALMVLLGMTLGQSLRTDGVESLSYGTWLCVEALLVLGYGMLRKLRVPFLGGILFFILGVLWLSIDPLPAANKWLLLGALGLLLVGVYVLLERRQEQLVRTGRIWFERVSSWG